MTVPSRRAYRAQVRSWLDEHKAEAPVLRGEGALTDPDEILAARRAWQGRLAGGRPGGRRRGRRSTAARDAARSSRSSSARRCARRSVPGILDVIGVGMLGPTIIAHGSEEQKSRYLGPMLHGDEVWCQLFSEPAAGSDLAAVQTRARLDDDGTLDAQRTEGLDDERPVLRLRAAARAHQPRRAQAQGHDDVHRPDGRGGRDRARTAPDLRRGRVQRGLLRRREARTPAPSSVRSTAAGASA